MTTAQKFDTIESGARALPARLRPAESHTPAAASQAGPFEVAADERQGSTVRDALMTGLLVIYPAFARWRRSSPACSLTGASGT